jgi:hypothetical protein
LLLERNDKQGFASTTAVETRPANADGEEILGAIQLKNKKH